ncbi:MAG TPA: hypothetical protein VGC66_01455 [Pyrinomonadaceae bacterium]
MSKAQYLLLAIFIGFYGLLFTYLVLRAFAGNVAARMKRIRPAVEMASRRVKRGSHRPWTAAVWRNA